MHMQKFFIILRFWGMGRQSTVKVISSLKAVATAHCNESCAPEVFEQAPSFVPIPIHTIACSKRMM
jgi:hypothetical protein